MTYASNKRKPDSSNPAWLDSLVGPLYLDFIAPYALERCLKTLKNQETRGFLRYRKIKVDLIPDDADTFRFVLSKTGYKYPTIEARGLLKRWETDSTLVTARVNIAAYQYLIMIFAIVLLIAFTGLMFVRLPWLILVFVGVFVLNWYFMRQRRDEIANLIESTLMAGLDEP